MSSTNDPFMPEPSQGSTPASPTPSEPAPSAYDATAYPAAAAPAPTYGQPAYGQQPTYGQPAYAYAPSYPKNWMGIVSLVTSLLGMGLVGVIFGHLGLSAANRGEANNKGLSIAGLIIGYLGILFAILYIIFIFAVFSTGEITTV